MSANYYDGSCEQERADEDDFGSFYEMTEEEFINYLKKRRSE